MQLVDQISVQINSELTKKRVKLPIRSRSIVATPHSVFVRRSAMQYCNPAPIFRPATES
jgi:hypothetical protein